MNVQDEIKSLKQRIAELESQVEQEKDFPRNGDDYWYMDGDIDVIDVEWDGGDWDQVRMSVGNVFKTKEQAEFALEKLKVEAELRKFSRPFEKATNNYFIKFELLDKTIAIDSDEYFQTQGTVYFETTNAALLAIDTVGEDRIKKYIFGVED